MAVGVIGMHQLSVGHAMTTGNPTAARTAAAHTHTASSAHADGGPVEHQGAASLKDEASATTGGTGGTHPIATPNLAGTGGHDESGGCAGCADHQLMLGTCLLALSLLVLSWTLTPPRPRDVPPFLLPTVAAATSAVLPGRWVPPLTLTELSLRRT